MGVDEMLCRWAERKYDVPGVTRVEFIYDEGFPGTDVTPADPGNIHVMLHTAEGPKRMWEDLEYTPELIREVLEFAMEVKS